MKLIITTKVWIPISMGMTTLVILLFTVLNQNVFALDPYAPKENRHLGFITVTTPLPSEDKITAINEGNNQRFELKSGEVMHVPIGKYRIEVQLQDKKITQSTEIKSTERSDVTIVGYGNFKVAADSAKKITLAGKSGNIDRNFKSGGIYTVPTGNYDVIVSSKNWKIKENIDVVTNTTRDVVVEIK